MSSDRREARKSSIADWAIRELSGGGSMVGSSWVPGGMDRSRQARYRIGQVVRHRLYPFRGIIFDVDPIFSHTEEWWDAIPEDQRPRKDQPFYHLFAENAETEYVAYVSEQNLLPDESGEPLRHPQVDEAFEEDEDGALVSRDHVIH